MPILFEIDPDLNLLYYACFGTCQADDFFNAERLAYKHELRNNNTLIIWDVRSVKELDFNPKDLKRAAEFTALLKEQNSTFERIAILSHNSFAENFVNAYRLLTSDMAMKIRTFRLVEEAAGWLGLSGKESQVFEIIKRLSDT